MADNVKTVIMKLSENTKVITKNENDGRHKGDRNHPLTYFPPVVRGFIDDFNSSTSTVERKNIHTYIAIL